MKKKGCFIVIVFCWPMLSIGQQNHFIDSLFNINFTALEINQYNYKREQIKALKKDIGLSAGVGISNFHTDEYDQGLSTRVYGRINLWGGGMKENAINAEIIRKQILIDSLNQNSIERPLNYGIYYDYIIYLFNQKKKPLLTEIITESKTHLNYLYELYYNKLIPYDQLINLKEIIESYQVILTSQNGYDNIVAQLINQKKLPDSISVQQVNFNFDTLSSDITKDTTHNDVLYLESSIIDDKFEKKALPQMSVNLGYDFSRDRTFYAFSCTKNLFNTSKKERFSEKQMILEKYKAQKFQKQKELVNYKYEFDFKEKQLSSLKYKMLRLNENKKILRSKRTILSLNESIEEKKITVDSLLIEYERMELLQQRFLILLQIKNTYPNIKIGEYINHNIRPKNVKKYMADRYIFIKNKESLSVQDKLFLQQNEINIIDAFDLIDLNYVVNINPADFTNRTAFEQSIKQTIDKNPNSNILISDLEDFKILEINTIKTKSVSQVSSLQ